MNFLKKAYITCVGLGMIVTSAASIAGTVTTSELGDYYIGSNGDKYSNEDYTPNNVDANYDVNWMKVSRTLNDDQNPTSGSLSVTVNSNFIGYDSMFKLGDLFLMNADDDAYNTASLCNGSSSLRGCDEHSYTAGTNKWEYAFDLGLDLADTSERNSTSDYTNEAGTLRELDQNGNVTSVSSDYHDSVNTSSQLVNGKYVRSWQVVDVKGTSTGIGSGSWSTSIADDNLVMTFDITNTTLMTAEQIALRWAMSCANDIIEVVTNFDVRTTGNKPDPIPEPSTILMMLLAGLGLVAARRKSI